MLIVHSNDLGDAEHVLIHLAGSLKNTQPLMRSIATLLENSTRKRFESKTAPDGTPWADWTERTKRQYAQPIWRTRNKERYLAGLKPRPKERLLRDSSRLLRSLTSHATQALAQVGTNIQYARYHQFGTQKMVARPIFGLSEQDRIDIMEVLHEFVQQQWSKA